MTELIDQPKKKVLVVEANPHDSLLWKDLFSNAQDEELEFIPIEELYAMHHQNGKKIPDLVLLDLPATGDDHNPLNLFMTIRDSYPATSIIIVTEKENPELADQVLSEGAQDWLVKNKLTAGALNRITHFTLARQKSIEQLRSFSLIDELTGLYNRRGFLTLAEQQLKLANRTGQSLLLAFVDVDGLKTINDLLGHQRGDVALVETAHVLREAFRETDILARLGGDEFVALLVCDEHVQPENLVKKFESVMEEHNAYGKSGFKLAASIGIAVSDPDSISSINDLLEGADKLMYEQKKSRKKNHGTYQLRFLKSAPIGFWLNSTAAMLNVMIPPETWPNPLPSFSDKVKKIKKALGEGLLTFVTRRSLCGTDEVCDRCCQPAPENKSPDRFEECVILGPTRPYLVEGGWTLIQMSELLTGALLKELPGARSASGLIQGVLQDALSAHLYENTNCHQVPLCEHSVPVNLKWELFHSRRHHAHPISHADRRQNGSKTDLDGSQNLETFFEKHHREWERMMSRKLQPAAKVNRPSQGHPKWFDRKKNITKFIHLLREFLAGK